MKFGVQVHIERFNRHRLGPCSAWGAPNTRRLGLTLRLRSYAERSSWYYDGRVYYRRQQRSLTVFVDVPIKAEPSAGRAFDALLS